MTSLLADHLLHQLDTANLVTEPWSHAYLPDALPAEAASELVGSFGSLDLTAYEETERTKSYRFRSSEIYGPNAAGPPRNRTLGAMVEVLTGAAYRRRMSELTGLDLNDRPVTIDMWEYRSGDWLAPHVDKPDKIVTQIFYLTRNWASGAGGRLLILRTSSADDVCRALPPRLGSSSVLVRSADSWHAVEASSGATARRSITAVFWRGRGPAPRTGR